MRIENRRRSFFRTILAVGVIWWSAVQRPEAVPVGVWTAIAGPTVARHSMGAATSGGFLFTFGGSVNLDVVEAYNPVTNTWSLRTPLPVGRNGMAAVAVPDGRIFVIGGTTEAGYGGSTTGFLARVDIYDPATDAWSEGPSLQTARGYHAAALAGDGRIYVIAGRTNGPSGTLNTVEVLDPVNGTAWTFAPAFTFESFTAAATGPDGKVYAVAGISNNTLVRVFDPVTSSWSFGPPLPAGTGRHSIGVTTGLDGKIYAVGGWNGPVGVAVRTVHALDTTTQTWSALPNLIHPRSAPGVATGPDGRIYAVSGSGAGQTAETFEPVGLAPVVTCSEPAAGSWHSAAAAVSCTSTTPLELAAPGDASFTLSTTADGPAVFTGGHAPVCDVWGRCSPAVGPFGPFQVDTSAPAVTISGVTNGATYLGTMPPAACSAVDHLSGLASPGTLATTGGPTGTIALTCSGATDNAGNVAEPVTAAVTVVEAPTITMTDLGGTDAMARAVNDAGVIVGQSRTPTGQHAVVWRDGVMTDLGTLCGDACHPSQNTSSAADINVHGDIVGYSFRADGGNQAVIWRNGVLSALPLLAGWPDSSAIAINDAGQIVGNACGAPSGCRAVLWASHTSAPENLGVIGSASFAYSTAIGLNDAGDIVGESSTAAGSIHAYRWRRETGMVDLGAASGSCVDRSVARGINSSGTIAGESYTGCPSAREHMVRWQDDAMEDLGTLRGPSGRSWTGRINEGGEIAGYSVDDLCGEVQAVLWSQGAMIPLGGHVLPTGCRYSFAYGLNDTGLVVGQSYTGTGEVHAVMWRVERPKDPQTITVTTAPPAEAAYGTTFDVVVNGGASGNPVDVTAEGACSVQSASADSATLMMTLGTGLCRVRYNQAGNHEYHPATEVITETTALKAAATLTITGFSGIYDGLAHGATGTATGARGEDLTALLVLGSAFTAAPGGDAAWQFEGDGNHLASSGTVQIVITPAILHVAAEPKTKVEGASDPALTYVATGWVADDTPTLISGALVREGGETPGSYEIRQGTLDAGMNYTIAYSSATFTIDAAPEPPSLAGRMHGHGRLDSTGNTRRHFVFDVGAAFGGRGRFHFWTTDRRDRPQTTHVFDATSIDTVAFSDDPGFRPGKRRAPTVDSVTFTGTGDFNDAPGFTFRVIATDQGEPGVGRDTLSLEVFDGTGARVYAVSGSLDGGNIQSRRLPGRVLAPLIVGGPDARQVVEATSAAGAVFTYDHVSAVDWHGQPVAVTCEPASGSVLPMGRTRGECHATDAGGRTSTLRFVVIVIDSQAPVWVTEPPDITVEATGRNGAEVTFAEPSASDAVDLAPKVSCSRNSGQRFQVGTTTVTCLAKDDSGNRASTSFRVTVEPQPAHGRRGR